MAERIDPKDAAKLLGMSITSLYGALQHNALDIGGAWKNEGSPDWFYHISPAKLGEYVGMTKEEVKEAVKEYQLAR